jgi:glutathione S-transferase
MRRRHGTNARAATLSRFTAVRAESIDTGSASTKGSREDIMAKAAKSKARAKSKTARRAPKAKPARKQAAKRPAPRAKSRRAKSRRAAARPAAARTALGRGQGRIVLYGHFNSMPSGKVRLMLALADAPFSYRHVDLGQGQQKTPEYLAVNRFGQVPALRHGDVTLVQSNVILRYLADLLGKFGARNEAEQREIAQWLDWEADLVSSGVRAVRAAVRFWKADPAVVRFVRGRAERALGMLESALVDRDYLVGGRPTIADIAALPHILVVHEGEFDLAPYPNVLAWKDRMMALPGAAHPYDLLPKEDRD